MTINIDEIDKDVEVERARQFSLTHARVDPAHALAPGLFRSLARAGGRDKPMKIDYKYGETTLQFKAPQQLGADDLRVMQGLIAMAAVSGKNKNGVVLSAESKTPLATTLNHSLWIGDLSDAEQTLVAVGRFGGLAREIGYSSANGGTNIRIRECIKRLGEVMIWQKIGKREKRFMLLSAVEFDEATGEFCVGINPRLAKAVFGAAKGTKSHCRVLLSEVRALESDPARVIHQRLCGFIDEGQSRAVSFDTLSGYAWPEQALSEAAARKRKFSIRKALEEFQALGWEVEEADGSKVVIKRPKRGNF